MAKLRRRVFKSSYRGDVAGDAWRRRYDDVSAAGLALRERRELTLHFLEGATGSIIDVGCGPALLGPDLERAGLRYFGVDASIDMLAGAEGRVALGDALTLPLRDRTFDNAVCVGVIDGLRDRLAAAREITRTVRPGGTLVISFANMAGPSVLWRTFVYVPILEAFKAVVQRRSLPRFPPRPMLTARSASRLLAAAGATVQDVEYWGFNVLPSPADELWPRLTLRLARALSRLRSGRFRVLALGFTIRAKVGKPS